MTRKKIILKKSILLTTSLALCITFCSNPTKETLKWRSNIELPVTNTAFVIGQEFGNLFGAIDTLKDFAMLGTNDTTADGFISDSPHVVAFSKSNKDTFSFQQKEDSMGNKTFQVNLGPIPLSTEADIDTIIKFNITGNIAADIRQNAADTIGFPKIRQIVIDNDPANCNLPVKIKNTTGTTLDSILITLANVFPTASSKLITSLKPGDSADLIFNLAGNTIDSSIQIRIAALLKAGGTIAVGSGLEISVSLSKIKASSAIVMDSLLNIADTFSNNYKITDSINIDYTDINYGFFNYTCNNKSGIDLYISAEHHDLWITPACVKKDVRLYTGISVFANASDSFNYYSGNILDGDRYVPARQNKRFARLNLSGNRMFPKWLDTNSVTRVDYFISTEPHGNWDTVNSTDSLIFTIQPSAVNYSEMAGVLMKTYEKTSDTQNVEIPFPFPTSDKDSLRKSFILERVSAKMDMTMNLADSAFIDSLLVNYKVVSPLYPDAITDTTQTFGRIKNDTVFKRVLNITNVVNNFPDSVKILTHITVPQGTRIRAINDKNSVNNDVGTMTVKSFINYDLTAYFDWNIAKLTTMDLGADTFTLDEKEMRTFRIMTDKSFSFHLSVANHSNIYIRLFALFAPDSLQTSLYTDSMGTNIVNDYVLDSTGKAEAAGYVNLLGSHGVYIPPRDSVADDSVFLDNLQMSRILGANRGSMRWMLKFMPTGRDSLTNVDNINIKSWIHLEGVNNMDSVITAVK
ncbi:MAG TPA: hypothetical protein DCO75_07815 [Fibrobacteres bacterium]|nr:hypothetical protein [Fibrobacterota bacterium]